mgnify:FL=1
MNIPKPDNRVNTSTRIPNFQPKFLTKKEREELKKKEEEEAQKLEQLKKMEINKHRREFMEASHKEKEEKDDTKK